MTLVDVDWQYRGLQVIQKGQTKVMDLWLESFRV